MGVVGFEGLMAVGKVWRREKQEEEEEENNEEELKGQFNVVFFY